MQKKQRIRKQDGNRYELRNGSGVHTYISSNYSTDSYYNILVSHPYYVPFPWNTPPKMSHLLLFWFLTSTISALVSATFLSFSLRDSRIDRTSHSRNFIPCRHISKTPLIYHRLSARPVISILQQSINSCTPTVDGGRMEEIDRESWRGVGKKTFKSNQPSFLQLHQPTWTQQSLLLPNAM